MIRSAHQSGSLFWLSAFALVASVAFAGATRPGFAGDVVAQVASVPALLAGLILTWRERDAHAWLLGWSTAVLLVILLQLVPLPPAVWAELPFGPVVQDVNAMAGLPNEWRPISVSPHDTWLSLLSFLPPAAVFFSVLHLDDREKTRLFQIALVAVLVSCAVGLWQVAAISGYASTGERPQSADPTGLFLNRNHFAALLYVGLLIAAAFMIDGWRHAMADPKLLGSISAFAAPALSLLLIVMALGLIVLARSRAGMIFAIAALVGAALIGRLPDPRRLKRGALRWIIAGGAAAFIIVSQYAFSRILYRFAEDPLQDGRTSIADTAWATGWSLMPFGTGLGTFVPVYKAVEQPSAALMGVYVNHAHNDFIEIWMETGLGGLLLLIFALIWLTRRLLVIFTSDAATWDSQGRLLTSAAGVVVILLLAHSLVDYPLRTGAMAAIFALCCGVLARPIGYGIPLGKRASETTGDKSGEWVPELPDVKTSSGPAFRQYEISAAVVPAAWSGTLSTPEPEPNTLVDIDRILLPSTESPLSRNPQAPQRGLPELGQDDAWPEQWRRPSRKNTGE